MNHIRPGFLKMTFAASMLLWASIVVTPATAGPVLFHFQGAVDNNVPGSLSSRFANGQSLSGNFTFDTVDSIGNTIADSNSNINIGKYIGAIKGLNLNFNSGGYVAQLGTGGSNFIQIEDGVLNDNFVVRAPINATNPGVIVNGFSPDFIRIEFAHGPGAFANDSLSRPTLGTFLNTGTFRFHFEDGDGGTAVLGGGVTILNTPLPPAVILFGAGLVALVGLGAGSWRLKGNSVA